MTLTMTLKVSATAMPILQMRGSGSERRGSEARTACEQGGGPSVCAWELPTV